MNDKELDAQTERVRKFVKKWAHIVTHWGWKFEMKYVACFDDMPSGTTSDEVAMITFPLSAYLRGDIYANLRVCSQLTDDVLEEVVVHELTHLLLAPLVLEPTSEQAKERTCTILARCILGVNK